MISIDQWDEKFKYTALEMFNSLPRSVKDSVTVSVYLKIKNLFRKTAQYFLDTTYQRSRYNSIMVQDIKKCYIA